MGRLPRFPPGRGLPIARGLLVLGAGEARPAELHVGGATTSITPDRPVPLAGQRSTRISDVVASPVTARRT